MTAQIASVHQIDIDYVFRAQGTLIDCPGLYASRGAITRTNDSCGEVWPDQYVQIEVDMSELLSPGRIARWSVKHQMGLLRALCVAMVVVVVVIECVTQALGLILLHVV